MRKHKAPRSKSIARRRAAKEARRRNRATSCRGPLPRPTVCADDPTLTSHAGLLPLISFMTGPLGLVRRFREIVGYVGRRRVHPVHLVLLAFVVGALAGVTRMAHLDEALRGDPVLVKFLRLSYWPVRKVFANALASLNDRARDALVDLVCELGLQTVPSTSPSVVVDIDPTAIVDHGEAEGARFGYCGKGRRRRRHYPIVASLAETRAIVLARYRDGSGITNEELIGILSDLMCRLRDYFGPGCELTLRGDAGIWSPQIGRWLRSQGVGFVMAIPLMAGVKLHLHTMDFEALDDEGDIQFGEFEGPKVGLGDEMKVAVIRRRVHDPAAPPLGKRVHGDERWRYQAIVSDRDWTAYDLWRFYNGRADCERVFRVGKQALGLGHLASRDFRANEIAFLLRSLAFNVDLRFQAHCEQRARQDGRPVQHVGLEWRQPRFYMTAGRLLRSAGGWVLRVPANAFLERLWAFYAPDLVVGVGQLEVTAA